MATAQTNVEIARCNLASADTLFSYAEGRYNIGTITENEMLQLRLNRLREENRMLAESMEILKNTTSYRVARKISDANIPFKEPLKKLLKSRRP